MSEQTFDPDVVARWAEPADRTRDQMQVWVGHRSTPETEALLLELRQLIARSVGKIVAEWAVTNWMITKRPIEQCVQIELEEQRPWPSRPRKTAGNARSCGQ